MEPDANLIDLENGVLAHAIKADFAQFKNVVHAPETFRLTPPQLARSDS